MTFAFSRLLARAVFARTSRMLASCRAARWKAFWQRSTRRKACSIASAPLRRSYTADATNISVWGGHAALRAAKLSEHREPLLTNRQNLITQSKSAAEDVSTSSVLSAHSALITG